MMLRLLLLNAVMLTFNVVGICSLFIFLTVGELL